MLKKRVMHRIIMIDIDKIFIAGGYNHEDNTLSHCEIFSLKYEEKTVDIIKKIKK